MNSYEYTCCVYAPVDRYGGYPARSRDFIKALIAVRPTWDIKIISCPWGNTRAGFLEDHQEEEILSRIIPNLESQPDYFISITVPNEWQKVGKFNIGVTAGIETTLCHADWIDGCNRMDLVLVSSQHGKTVFENSRFDIQDTKTKQILRQVQLQTPVEVLMEGVDLDKYFPKGMPKKTVVKTELTSFLDTIPESYLYLVVGMWMQGVVGEDRKNIGDTVKMFLETFKNVNTPPALLLKVHQATASLMDREKILGMVNEIRKMVPNSSHLNIYLLHGDLSDSQMNELYNHPKIKTLISLTKGEGFGRPLLEFSVTGKPIIASGWSGHVDFLNKDFIIFVSGTLEPVHTSAVVDKVIMKEAKWFKPDRSHVTAAYLHTFKEYERCLRESKKQGQVSRKNWSMEDMKKQLHVIVEEKIPILPRQMKIKLPPLKKKEQENG